MNDTHIPTPEFGTHLEWQIRTELRRRERFGDEAAAVGPRVAGLDGLGARRVARWRWARSAALVIVSVVVGAGGTVAAERYQSSRRAEILLEQTRLRLQLSEARLDDARVDLERVEALARAGVIGEDARLAARQHLDDVMREFELESLDLEEIALSGRSPRREISADRIAGRDFVAERLQRRLSAATERLETARRGLERLQKLHEAGRVSESSLREAEGAAHDARTALAALEGRLGLRHRFVTGELSAQEAEREDLRVAARHARERHTRRLVLARRVLEVTRQRKENGITTSAELRRAETRVREIEVDLRLAELQLRLVDEGEREEPR